MFCITIFILASDILPATVIETDDDKDEAIFLVSVNVATKEDVTAMLLLAKEVLTADDVKTDWADNTAFDSACLMADDVNEPLELRAEDAADNLIEEDCIPDSTDITHEASFTLVPKVKVAPSTFISITANDILIEVATTLL